MTESTRERLEAALRDLIHAIECSRDFDPETFYLEREAMKRAQAALAPSVAEPPTGIALDDLQQIARAAATNAQGDSISIALNEQIVEQLTSWMKELLARAVAEKAPAPHDDDAECFYCGKMTNSMHGNPGLWPLRFCQPDGTGITRTHHVHCVVSRLKAAEKAAPAAPPRKDLEKRLADFIWDAHERPGGREANMLPSELAHKIVPFIQRELAAATPLNADEIRLEEANRWFTNWNVDESIRSFAPWAEGRIAELRRAAPQVREET